MILIFSIWIWNQKFEPLTKHWYRCMQYDRTVMAHQYIAGTTVPLLRYAPLTWPRVRPSINDWEISRVQQMTRRYREFSRWSDDIECSNLKLLATRYREQPMVVKYWEFNQWPRVIESSTNSSSAMCRLQLMRQSHRELNQWPGYIGASTNEMRFLTWRSAYVDSSSSEIQNVRCRRYSTVIFLQNSHKRHPISRPWGRGMGCLLLVRSHFRFSEWRQASPVVPLVTQLVCVNGHITKYSGIAWLCAFSL